MGKVVLDTSILLGLADAADALHDAVMVALRERERKSFVIPTSVMAEVMVGAIRKGAKAVSATEAMIEDLVTEVLPIDRDTAKTAARIRARHKSIRLPDAFVLAAGEMLDSEILTGDKHWSRVDRRVTVLNPAPNLLPRQADVRAKAVRQYAVASLVEPRPGEAMA